MTPTPQWKMVPVEPDDAMRKVLVDVYLTPATWARLLAAAPPAPTDTEAVALLRELLRCHDERSDSLDCHVSTEAARAFLSAQPPAVDDALGRMIEAGSELERAAGVPPYTLGAPPTDIERGGEAAWGVIVESSDYPGCREAHFPNGYPPAGSTLYTAPVAGWDEAWISVADRLPTKRAQVLWFDAERGPWVGIFYGSETFASRVTRGASTTTHWMPLPSPPASRPTP